MKLNHDTDEFTFVVQHIGLDMDFHHPKGRQLGMAPETIEKFESEREHAEIFIQSASGTAFSTEELLNWFLLQTGKSLAENLPAAALDKGRASGSGHVFVTFPIRFEEGVFHMQTEDGPQDLSGLKMMAKVTFAHRDG